MSDSKRQAAESKTASEVPLLVLDQVSKTFTVTSNETTDTRRTFRNFWKSAMRTHTETIRALKPTTLIVERGESIGVVGTNGSGKTTLMKIIAGQHSPSSGRVWATSNPVLLGVNAALIPNLTGRENIKLGCLAMGMSAAELQRKEADILELSGLEEHIHLPLQSYSSGMSSRLQFAIATSIDPEILIIDEALNTGDAQFRESTRKRVDELRSQAGCVLIVSHSLDTIRQMCSRVLWIDKGELIMDGDPKTVTENYQTYTAHRGHGRDKAADKLRSEKQAELVGLELVWTD